MVAARVMRLSSPRQGSARHFPHCDQRGIAMTDTALQAPPIEPAARTPGPNLDKGFNPLTLILFMGVMAAGLLYVVYSSHTLIGSIIGVGIANALSRGLDGTSGVDWSKATEIGYALLLSPLVGFVASALLLLALKFLVRNPALYAAPKGNQPPPWWIRGILILTCTGVSFAHGSNDAHNGMGLLMLILIGTG